MSFVEIDPVHPEPWKIGRVADLVRKGGVVILPTDTVYAFACRLGATAAVERLYALKGLAPSRRLSILVSDLSMAGPYVRGISTPVYRVMKRVLPGPYTFILEASPALPRVMLRKRKTVGVRIPASPIAAALLAELDEPLLSTSVRSADETIPNDPAELAVRHAGAVDLVIDGGPLVPTPSTVVDLSDAEPVLVREGKGDVEALGIF